MILRLKYQFWHKNTNNYLDFQEFIEKVTKTAVLRELRQMGEQLFVKWVNRTWTNNQMNTYQITK